MSAAIRRTLSQRQVEDLFETTLGHNLSFAWALERVSSSV